jgi:hypothetical protein
MPAALAVARLSSWFDTFAATSGFSQPTRIW